MCANQKGSCRNAKFWYLLLGHNVGDGGLYCDAAFLLCERR